MCVNTQLSAHPLYAFLRREQERPEFKAWVAGEKLTDPRQAGWCEAIATMIRQYPEWDELLAYEKGWT